MFLSPDLHLIHVLVVDHVYLCEDSDKMGKIVIRD